MIDSREQASDVAMRLRNGASYWMLGVMFAAFRFRLAGIMK
jgi:hypothetical protein